MANEKRLIDANAIKYHKETECFGHGDFQVVRKVYEEEIDEMPTVDAVEVVRCKDCKYWEQNCALKDFGVCCRVDYDPPATRADDFCSYGERKDNE